MENVLDGLFGKKEEKVDEVITEEKVEDTTTDETAQDVPETDEITVETDTVEETVEETDEIDETIPEIECEETPVADETESKFAKEIRTEISNFASLDFEAVNFKSRLLGILDKYGI